MNRYLLKLGIILLFVSSLFILNCAGIQKNTLELNSLFPGSNNEPLRYSVLPNDPLLDQQFGIRNVKADLSWKNETGVGSVIVAVIDTGVDWKHPDLQKLIWVNPGEDINSNGIAEQSDLNGKDDDGNGFVDDIIGWDFWSNDNDPMDTHGHGTSVAGIISADTNNGIGIAGCTWNCKIMPIRVRETTRTEFHYMVAKGMKYAVENGAKVINLSLDSNIPVIKKTIKWTYKKGAVIVGTAGNQNSTMNCCPDAHFKEVICVASLDWNDRKWISSNYGENIDICAPTLSVTTTICGSYGRGGGTSHATPYVTALAALLFSKHPNWTNEKVIRVIIDSADSIDAINPKYKGQLGAGKINFLKALSY